MITSLQNKRVKEALKLRRRRGRDAQNRFLIDGLREIQQSLAAGVETVEAFVCDELCDENAQQLVDQIRSRTGDVCLVNLAVWEKLSYGHRRDGVLVVVRYAPDPIDQLQPLGDGPIVVLDRIEKPGNVGAVFRTATAAGAAAIIASEPQTDLFNPNAIRASLGTIFRLPLAQATAAQSLAWLQTQQLPIFVAQVDATRTVYDVDLAQRCAVVLGSEAHGVGPVWHDPAVTAVALPMQGPIDSLNVANTAAVLLYEALRQRRSRSV
jgi:TrmH family RNA methyltransferase